MYTPGPRLPRHALPAHAEWCVIGLPAGTLTLNRQLHIKRPRLVLRGAGSDRTVLRVDKPLKDTPDVPRPKGGWGYFVQEAFIMFTGRYLRDAPLASVTGSANRGGRKLAVGAPLKIGACAAAVVPAQPTTSAHAAEPSRATPVQTCPALVLQQLALAVWVRRSAPPPSCGWVTSSCW